jgi:VWFA-related protein
MKPAYRRNSSWRPSVLLSFVAAAGAVLAAGQAPPSDAIVIDFIATASDGKPITDLKAEEVTLRVDGRQRPVRSLQLVQHARASAAAGSPASDPPPMPFGLNTSADTSRAVLFAVEDLSIKASSGRAVRDGIVQFLNGVSGSDRVGLVTLPQSTIRVDLSAGAAKVREAAQQLNGRAPATSTNAENTCRTRDTLEALRNLLGGLAGSDTPTTVLVFSGGLIGSARTASQTGSGACDLTTEHFSSIGRASSLARAQVYVILADENVTGQSEGLESLAGVTGGRVLRLAVSGESAIDRAARETSSYYVASFDPDPKERDGQDHRLEVRLARQDAQLRSRTVLTIPKGDARSGKPGAMNPRDMVKQTTAFRDLPLRVVAYTSRGTGDNVNIFIMAEPVDAATKLTAASAAIADKANKASAVTIDDKGLAARPIMTQLSGPPGPYRVRFAATDSSGRSGAVDYSLNAELTPAGPLKMSGLVVAALRDKSMAPTMQFKDEASAVGYVEIYGQLSGKVSARMEIAETVDGPAIKKIQPGGQTTSEADKFLLIGELPIADLKPGDYVVRAFIGLEGQPEGRVIRTLRKVQ